MFSFRSLCYFAYAVLLTAVLLYVRFPAEKFKEYCEKRIERLLPGSACNVDHIGYSFPLSTVLENIVISRVVGGQESDMVVDRLAISPEPLLFWKAFKLKGEIYSGLFEAGLDFDTGAQTFQLENIRLEGLEAGKLAESIGLTDRKISGILGFSGSYQAPNSHPSDGSGEGVVEVVTGSMALLQPILALSTIKFEKIAVGVTRENGILRFIDGELLGEELIADFTGELRLVSPLLNSNIILKGHLEPDDGFLKSHPEEQQVVQRLLQRYKMTVLPFKVGGTVKRPLFRFST
jgi:type II secretion system protein N